MANWSLIKCAETTSCVIRLLCPALGCTAKSNTRHSIILKLLRSPVCQLLEPLTADRPVMDCIMICHRMLYAPVKAIFDCFCTVELESYRLEEEDAGRQTSASKEGCFLNSLKPNTETARDAACACLEYSRAADCTVGYSVRVNRSVVRWVSRFSAPLLKDPPILNILGWASDVKWQTTGRVPDKDRINTSRLSFWHRLQRSLRLRTIGRVLSIAAPHISIYRFLFLSGQLPSGTHKKKNPKRDRSSKRVRPPRSRAVLQARRTVRCAKHSAVCRCGALCEGTQRPRCGKTVHFKRRQYAKHAMRKHLHSLVHTTLSFLGKNDITRERTRLNVTFVRLVVSQVNCHTLFNVHCTYSICHVTRGDAVLCSLHDSYFCPTKQNNSMSRL